MIWVNGEVQEQISISDRGLQYGDGVWETIAVRLGEVKQLAAHMARLQVGLDALAITGIKLDAVAADILSVVEDDEDTIIKVIITRGSGGRGFSYTDIMEPVTIISKHPMPSYPASYYEQGIRLTLCETRLPDNPRLAGFKRLGCIEQVLARAEFKGDFQEGVVRSYKGHVIEGTMSNLFLITTNDKVITPDLQNSGVDGIARACIIGELQRMDIEVEIQAIKLDDVMQAQGIFMSNSIIYAWPVKEFAGKTYSVPNIFRKLERNLQKLL